MYTVSRMAPSHLSSEPFFPENMKTNSSRRLERHRSDDSAEPEDEEYVEDVGAYDVADCDVAVLLRGGDGGGCKFREARSGRYNSQADE